MDFHYGFIEILNQLYHNYPEPDTVGIAGFCMTAQEYVKTGNGRNSFISLALLIHEGILV